MGNVVEFILSLKDLMSSGMHKAAATAQASLNKVASTAKKAEREVGNIGMAAQRAAGKGQKSIAVLERALRMLERKRRLLVDDSALIAAKHKAERLKAEINRLNNLGSSPKGAGAVTGGSAGGGTGSLSRMVKGGAIAYVAKEAIGMAIGAGREAYGSAMGRAGTERAINVTTHGQGKEAIAQTRSIADKYGIDYSASLEGVKTLTGGLMGMNMPLKEQMKIFEGVGTGVAALNLNAEAAQGAFLALGQMASKGTVSAEELRGQLGERIPGAFSIAAKAMGVTEAKLGDMMKQGEILSSDFLPKFAAEMQKTFGDDALKNANGPATIQARFGNALEDLKVVFGQGLIPIITPMMEALIPLAQEILPAIGGLFTSISEVLPIIKSNVMEILEPITAIQINTEAWRPTVETVKTYFFQMVATVKQILSTIMSVVGGVVQWLANSQILRDVFGAIYKVGTVVLGVIEGIAAILKGIFENVVVPILNGIESAYRFLTGAKSMSEELSAQKAAETAKNETEFRANLEQIQKDRENKEFRASLEKIEADRLAKTANKPAIIGGGGGGKSKGKGGSGLSSKGVTHSGPQAITININKEMIGQVELKTITPAQGVNQMESMLEEMLLRLFNSLKTAN